MGEAETLARLVAVLRAMGAEKLVGRLEGAHTRGDVRQALAFARGEVDEVERVLGINAGVGAAAGAPAAVARGEGVADAR